MHLRILNPLDPAPPARCVPCPGLSTRGYVCMELQLVDMLPGEMQLYSDLGGEKKNEQVNRTEHWS